VIADSSESAAAGLVRTRVGLLSHVDIACCQEDAFKRRAGRSAKAFYRVRCVQ